jgi:hypothetical protein
VAAGPTVTGDSDRRTCPDGACRMRVVGYLRGPGSGGLDCDSPLRWMCDDCGTTAIRRCSGRRESVCKPCAARYRRRVRAVALSGMTAQRSSVGYLYLLTVTAPGDKAHSLPGGQRCPCTPPGGVDLPEWNASHSRRWNHLRTALRRDYEGLQFMRGVEVQNRGALHDHAMVWSPVPLNLVDVRKRAMAAGFGHSVDLAPCAPGSRKAAYYVSKYVTKATDSREQVPWAADVVDFRTGEVSRGLVPGRYRTWSCSRGWGLRMADVVAQAREYAMTKAAADREAEVDAAILVLAAVFGPVEPLADSGG